jgi:hypothetical protein
VGLGADISEYEHEKMKLAGNFNCNVNQFKRFLLLWKFVKHDLISYLTKFSHINFKNQDSYIKWKLALYTRFQVHTLISPHQGSLKFKSCQIYQIWRLYFTLNPTFILLASFTAKLCRVLVEKMTKKCQFFTFFGVTRQNFLGSRWNISTNETVLKGY